jgi:hypothetical protein
MISEAAHQRDLELMLDFFRASTFHRIANISGIGSKGQYRIIIKNKSRKDIRIFLEYLSVYYTGLTRLGLEGYRIFCNQEHNDSIINVNYGPKRVDIHWFGPHKPPVDPF